MTFQEQYEASLLRNIEKLETKLDKANAENAELLGIIQSMMDAGYTMFGNIITLLDGNEDLQEQAITIMETGQKPGYHAGFMPNMDEYEE